MTADLLVTNISQLATPRGAGAHRGAVQREVHVVADAAIAVRDGVIEWVGARGEWRGEAREVVDAGGRAVIPGLVDSHTHAVWTGDRLADFEARASGADYQQILAAGGGIRHTMRETAAASEEVLAQLARERVLMLARSGATTVEIKSGYGFTPEAELASLRAIRRVAGEVPTSVVPTLLIHVPPRDVRERADYVRTIAESLVPMVARERLAMAVDVFVEREAFQVDEAATILEAAQLAGLGAKLHADQFNAIGGVELAVSLGALSVDHLEASGPAQIAALARGNTVATVLPGVTLHLGLPPAPARKLVDAGAPVAVATDLNPGSSPLYSLQLAMALSVRLNGLSPAEALVAATVNGAVALGLSDRGRLEPGCRADMLILESSDWREATYALGSGIVERVFVEGREEITTS